MAPRASEILPVLPLRGERRRFLFDLQPHPMWVFDPQTFRFLAVNEAAVRSYGYSREEWLEMSLFDIRPEEEQKRLRTLIEEGGLPAAIPPTQFGTWTHRRKDGSEMQVDVTVSPVRYAGRPARLALALDVTERLRAERALRESERRYRMLVEQSPDPILVHDGERLVYLNGAAAAVLGSGEPGSLVGRSIYDFIPAELRDAVRHRIREMVEGEDQAPMAATRLLRVDGRTIEVEGTAVRIRYGGLPATQLVLRDVTDRRRDEEARARHARKLAQLAEASLLLNSSLSTEVILEEIRRHARELTGAVDVSIRLVPKGPHRSLQPSAGWVSFPLLGRGRRFLGRLELFFDLARPPSVEDEVVLVQLAQMAATAIENAAVFEQVGNARDGLDRLLRRLVETTDHERRSLARELREEVAQTLVGVQLALATRDGSSPGAPPAAGLLAVGALRSLVSQLRSLTTQLDPPVLEREGLVNGLRELSLRQAAGEAVRVRFAGDIEGRRFPPSVERAAYRIVEELGRGALGGAVVVEVEAGEAELRLSIHAGGDIGAIALAEHARGGGGALEPASPGEALVFVFPLGSDSVGIP